MAKRDENTLIHEWNIPETSPPWKIKLNDETLRDGLQSPSVTDPPIEDKIEILHLMEDLGVSGEAIFHLDPCRPVCITVEGSVFYHLKSLKTSIEYYLKRLGDTKTRRWLIRTCVIEAILIVLNLVIASATA